MLVSPQRPDDGVHIHPEVADLLVPSTLMAPRRTVNGHGKREVRLVLDPARYAALQRCVARHHITVTALIEALGQRVIDEENGLVEPEHIAALDDVLDFAREITQTRRSRKPKPADG